MNLPLNSLGQAIEKRCNMAYWSCDTIGTGTGIMQCQQIHQWHHCISWVR